MKFVDDSTNAEAQAAKNKKKNVIIFAVFIAVIAIVLVVVILKYAPPGGINTAKDVTVEIINPNTGEVLKHGDTVYVGAKETPIEVVFRDAETGERITDEVLSPYRLDQCYRTYINGIKEDYFGDGTLFTLSQGWPGSDSDDWDTEKLFSVHVIFDSIPLSGAYGSNERKYNRRSAAIEVYILPV